MLVQISLTTGTITLENSYMNYDYIITLFLISHCCLTVNSDHVIRIKGTLAIIQSIIQSSNQSFNQRSGSECCTRIIDLHLLPDFSTGNRAGASFSRPRHTCSWRAASPLRCRISVNLGFNSKDRTPTNQCRRADEMSGNIPSQQLSEPLTAQKAEEHGS